MIPDIKGPLVFGNKEQIDAIRKAEVRAEFNDIPKCEECDGTGECECEGRCPNCEGCIQCDGNGKDYSAYEKFKEKHPEFRP